MKQRLSLPVGFWLVLILAILYAGVSARASIQRIMSLQTVGWDITNITQTVWNTAHGAPFAMTNLYPLDNRLGTHVEPLTLLLAPLAWVVGDAPHLAFSLLILQAIIVASGAIPLYLLGRDILKNEYGAVTFAVLYLLYPAVGAILSFEFHMITFVAGFWLWVFYFLHRRQWLGVVIFSLLAAACKENLPLLLATFGVYLVLSKRGPWKLGTTLALVGTIWFLVGVFWLQPHFSPTDENIQMRNYAWMGDTLYDKATFLISKPQEVWLRLTYQDRLQKYIWELLAPWGFTSVLSPLQLLITLPEVMINLFSDKRQQGRVEDTHYAAALIPFVAWSALLGSAWLLRQIRSGLEKLNRQSWHKYITFTFFSLLLAWSFIYHYYRGYSPLARPSLTWEVDPHARGVNEFIPLVPSSASILAQPNLGPFFSQRRYIYSDFLTVPKVDFILVDAKTLLEIEGLHRRAVTFINNNQEFGLVKAEDGYALLQRGADPATLPDQFFDFARVSSDPAEYPTQVRFGQALEFLGYDLELYRDSEPVFYLYFRLLKPLDESYHIALYLLDENGQVEGGSIEESPVMAWYPMEQWQVGEVVRLRYHVVPWNTRPVQEFGYALGVLSAPDLWDVTARLRPTIVDSEWQSWLPAQGSLLGLARLHKVWGLNEGGPPLRLMNLPGRALEKQVVMAEGIRLAGVELPPAVRAGDPLSLTLYWQSEGPTATSYTTFVHLLDETGVLVAQSDTVPGQGALPSTYWTPGEIIPDPHSISLPDQASGQTYTVLVGLYDPATGRRLSIMDEDVVAENEAVVLGRIQVK